MLRRFYSAFPSPGSLLLSHLPQARLDLRLGLPAVEDSPAKVSKTEVLGSAILAAVGAGIYPNIQEAARHMVHTSHRIEPDQQRHQEYQFYVEKYIATYPQMRDLMHDVAQHVAGRKR